jgi:hypothetical protein
MNIDVRADFSKVRSLLSELEAEHKIASVRALNRGAEASRTEAVKDLRKIYPGLKAGSIRARIDLRKATRGKLQSAATFSSSRIPLMGNFGMRARGQFGVRFKSLPYRIETVKGDKVDSAMLERAFRNRLNESGRAVVLSRHGKARYPIGVLLAPPLSKAVVEKKLIEGLAKVGRDRLVAEYERSLRFLIEKRKAKR